MNDFREFSELYHYGIKGMHWGIRRYQNPDGTLTELGKKHYDQEVDVIKNQYNKNIAKSEKKISKANEYLKLDKNIQKDKKVQKAKAVKAYEKAKIKMYKDLANAELKKLKDTPIDKIANKRSKDTGKAIAKSVLSTVALNMFFGSFVNPNNVHYNYYGGVAYGRDLNLLDSKERMDIINKDLASVTSKQGQRNLYYRDTYRPNNYISKRRNLKHGVNDFRDVHEDYLMHFGILGMKWGVRRYQNQDGTLTDAGKKRYYKEEVKKANKQIDREKRGISSYELSKTDYIKEAIKDFDVIDRKTGYVGNNYTAKDVENLARKLSSNKLGMYVQGEKDLTEDALYEALKTKYDDEKKKWNETREKVEKLQKKKIEAANNIDLEDVKNKIPMKEVKDKWEKAAKQDTYDLDFLEITQNDYDEMPEEAAKKQRLKDYGDYLNAQKLSNMVIDKHKNSSDLDNAADLGLKAFNKINPNFNDSKPGDKGSRDWFTYEDQTIGYTEVADLCKKMKDSGCNKKDVLNALKGIKDNKFIENFQSLSSNSEGLWDLDWFTGSEITGKYAQEHGKPGEKYIDAIFAILESEGKIQHNNTNKIFEKFGII